MCLTSIREVVTDEKHTWIVGIHEANDDGEITGFHAMETFDSKHQAAEYLHWLEGGMRDGDVVKLLRALDAIAAQLNTIWRSIPRS